MSLLPGDSPKLRKQRGAFFTPASIADFLAAWATAGRADARVLDPTCGEAVFLLAAARRLAANGGKPEATRDMLHGVDLHDASLEQSRMLLNDEGLALLRRDARRLRCPRHPEGLAEDPRHDELLNALGELELAG